MSQAQSRNAVSAKTGEGSASLRRLLDIILAATGLIIGGPGMLLIGLAVWISDRGPIFFSQRRLGLNGRHFRMYKFRKFSKQHGTSGCPLTMRNDDRMTPLGRVLGRTKLDELPQLWNVLKGDMSIVGPRPESLEFADCFADPYRSVLNHKPGIFGPSQAFFRDECSLFPAGGDPTHFYRSVLFPLKARFDLSYYPTRTIKSDLVWLVRAVLAVVGRQPSAALPGASKGPGEWPANWASAAGVSAQGPLTWVR